MVTDGILGAVQMIIDRFKHQMKYMPKKSYGTCYLIMMKMSGTL